MKKVTELEKKFGFPLFCYPTNNVYLGNSKKLIISDIWSFWDYVIKKKNFNRPFMNSLLEQAKNFYEAAENSPLKSKPLLYYYSFLNLAKLMINIDKQYGSNNLKYMHGVKEVHNNKFSDSEITIQQKKNFIKNVSVELLEIFDDQTFNTDTTIKVKDLLAHCVGIHRAYGEIYSLSETFFKLDRFMLYKRGKILGVKSKIQCSSKDSQALKNIGYNVIENEDGFYWNEEITRISNNITRSDYATLAKKMNDLGIWYFIGDNGYTSYLSSNPNCRYKPEIIIYNTMFYLGSITRYHPYMFDKIFSDKEQWMMSEFLTTQPKQFLYLATAKTLGQNVLKAYTSF